MEYGDYYSYTHRVSTCIVKKTDRSLELVIDENQLTFINKM